MKTTSIFTVLFAFILVGMCSSYKFRLFNAIITNEPALMQAPPSKYTTDASTYPTMPCLALEQSSYKLFNYYGAQSQAKDGYSYTLKDGRTVQFNICTSPAHGLGCPKNSAFGYILSKDKESCWPVFTPGVDNFNFEVTSKSKESEEILYTSFQPVYSKNNNDHKDQNLMFNYQFDCIKEGGTKVPVITEIVKSGQPLTLNIKFHNQGFCGADAQRLIILVENNMVLSGIFLLVSLPLIFFGIKFIKKSLATIGFLSGLISFSYVVSIFSNFMIWDTTSWVIFSVAALIVGVLIAVASYNSPTLAVLVAGCVLGYVSGNKLVHIYASLMKVSPTDTVIGIVIGIFVCLGFILAYKMRKHVIIWATSFGGAQLFTFGLGTLLHNYPDYKLISQRVSAGKWNSISQVAWGYIGGSILLFIIGAIVQYKRYMKNDDEEKKEGDSYNDFSGDADVNFKQGDAGYY